MDRYELFLYNVAGSSLRLLVFLGLVFLLVQFVKWAWAW